MRKLQTDAGVIYCRDVVNGVAVDPLNPPGWCDPIRRPADEIALWRNRPYIVTDGDLFIVMCLYQASDEPRWCGQAGSVPDALKIARFI
ncbi:hypothetical protein [Loktanella salsilacus]|nr:hypothetical protein [Loktanella salsilacus]